MPYRLPTRSVIQIYFDISLREEKLHCLEKQTKNWTEQLKNKAYLNFLKSYKAKLWLKRLIKTFLIKWKYLIFENSEVKDNFGWIMIYRITKWK